MVAQGRIVFFPYDRLGGPVVVFHADFGGVNAMINAITQPIAVQPKSRFIHMTVIDL